MSLRPSRIKSSLLGISALAIIGLFGHEQFSSEPYVPTKGDVPTIGYGTTVYPNGEKVTMADKPISREYAAKLASSYISKDEQFLQRTLGNVMLYQHEYDAYLTFLYQFGQANWQGSSMLKFLKSGEYEKACNSLLLYRRQAGRDCSDPAAGEWGKPTGCKGVWLRQQERAKLCLTGKYPANWSIENEL